MNTKMLESKMALYGDNGGDLAQALGISRTALSYKKNGKAKFMQNEILTIKERYKLTAEELDEIFFN